MRVCPQRESRFLGVTNPVDVEATSGDLFRAIVALPFIPVKAQRQAAAGAVVVVADAVGLVYCLMHLAHAHTHRFQGQPVA